MSIINALTYTPLYPCTDNEWENLPHVILTSDKECYPTVLGCEGQVYNELWFDAQSSFLDYPDDKTFNEVGYYRFRSNNHQLFFFDAESFKDHNIDDVIQSFISCNKVTTKSNHPEHELIQPLFNWKPLDLIKKIFQLSTQHARTPESSVMNKTCHSPFTALNVKRRSEPVATYTFYCDAPVIDDG